MSDSENIVAGRNPVTEAIKAGRTIDKIYVKSGDKAARARDSPGKGK